MLHDNKIDSKNKMNILIQSPNALYPCPKSHHPHRGRHPDGKTSSSNFPNPKTSVACYASIVNYNDPNQQVPLLHLGGCKSVEIYPRRLVSDVLAFCLNVSYGL